MLRSIFQTRQTDPIKVGEEAKQIRINFLMPIVLLTLLLSLAAVLISVISKEFLMMVAFSISAIILFICFNLLRNKNLKAPAILFLFQGYGLLTVSLLFDGGYQLSGILFVIFYLMIAGIIFNPKVFFLFFIFSAGLLFLMLTDILPPIFPALNLPGWFNSASRIVVIGLIGLVAYLSYLSIEQALQIAMESNKDRDQVEQEKRKFALIVDQSPQSIFITDLHGKIKYVNPKFTELMGYSTDEVYNKTPQILKTEFTPPEFYENLWQTITNDGKWVGEFVNRCKDDTTIYQSAVIAPLTDTSGEKTHYVAFEDDITLRKEMAYEIGELDKQLQEKSGELTQLNEQLQEQTLRDRLTGLYNRVYLSEILPREILRSVRARNHLILMIIDVDHFRSINAKYGHSIGDLVLQSISKSIMESKDHYDLVFRYGGDEFLLLFSGETNDFGMTRTEQLRKSVTNHPVQIDGNEITITVSIGIAVYPLHGKKEDELLTNAEKALALSRQSGDDRATIWKEELNDQT